MATKIKASNFGTSANTHITAKARGGQGGNIVFEGATDDAFETTLTVADPIEDRTIILPNASGYAQLNQGKGETNGNTQNFQQNYQSSSYFTAGEYIEIASISPTGNSRNYSFCGTIHAQVSGITQILTINAAIRFSSSGNMTYGIAYNSSTLGDDYIEPVYWINTSTDNIKLLMKSKTGSMHSLAVNLFFFQRGDYNNITWNDTVQNDVNSIPSGYAEYTGEKTLAKNLNGAVELYHNNVKKLETISTGVDVTGTINADSATINLINITQGGGTNQMQVKNIYGAGLQIGGNWLRLMKPDFSADMGVFKPGAEVELYHNGSQKFETTSTGIDVTGYITSDQPAFDAAQPGQNSGDLSSWGFTAVNTGNHWNASTGRFTAPVTGVYLFYFGAIKNNATNTVTRVYLKINGSRLYPSSSYGRHLRLDTGQAYGDNGTINFMVSMTASDYVQLECGAGSVYNGTDEYTTFGGYLIG